MATIRSSLRSAAGHTFSARVPTPGGRPVAVQPPHPRAPCPAKTIELLCDQARRPTRKGLPHHGFKVAWWPSTRAQVLNLARVVMDGSLTRPARQRPHAPTLWRRRENPQRARPAPSAFFAPTCRSAAKPTSFKTTNPSALLARARGASAETRSGRRAHRRFAAEAPQAVPATVPRVAAAPHVLTPVARAATTQARCP